MIMTAFFIPVTFVLMRAENCLIYLGQDAQVAAYAQEYVLAFLPGLYIMGLADCQRRFLNNFGRNFFSFLSGAIGLCLHGIWCYIFLFVYDLKITGIGYANVCSQVVVYCMLLIFTYLQKDLREAWYGPDFRIF